MIAYNPNHNAFKSHGIPRTYLDRADFGVLDVIAFVTDEIIVDAYSRAYVYVQVHEHRIWKYEPPETARPHHQFNVYGAAKRQPVHEQDPSPLGI